MRTLKFLRAMVADHVLSPLVDRTIAGEVAASKRLQEVLWPGLLRVSSRWRGIASLSDAEDGPPEISLRVLERLYRNEPDVLKRVQKIIGTGDDRAWPFVCRIAQRKAFQYVRNHPENLGHMEEGGEARFVTLVPLEEAEEDLLPASDRIVDRIDARAIAEYAERTLSPPQLQAARLHFIGHDDEGIARALGLPGPDSAVRLVRSAVARLRHGLVLREGNRPVASDGIARHGLPDR